MMPTAGCRAPPSSRAHMAEPLLSVDQVSCRFGGLLAVNSASLTVPAGSIRALIGPNGAGKTTLFAIISGFQRPSGGVVRYQGETITGLPPHELAWRGIARTFQIVQPFAGLSVRENILVGAHLRHPKRGDALAAADIVGREGGLGARPPPPPEAGRAPRARRYRRPRSWPWGHARPLCRLTDGRQPQAARVGTCARNGTEALCARRSAARSKSR